MQLTMREQEKMMISLAAMIAQRRKDKGRWLVSITLEGTSKICQN